MISQTLENSKILFIPQNCCRHKQSHLSMHLFDLVDKIPFLKVFFFYPFVTYSDLRLSFRKSIRKQNNEKLIKQKALICPLGILKFLFCSKLFIVFSIIWMRLFVCVGVCEGLMVFKTKTKKVCWFKWKLYSLFCLFYII